MPHSKLIQTSLIQNAEDSLEKPTQDTKEKRISMALPLVLIASTTALSACGNGKPNQMRDEYKSFEDCQADWGGNGTTSPCQPQNPNAANTSNYHNGTHYISRMGPYFGPSYYDGQRDTLQRQYLGDRFTGAQNHSHFSSRSVVSRGGFGSSSRGFSSGG